MVVKIYFGSNFDHFNVPRSQAIFSAGCSEIRTYNTLVGFSPSFITSCLINDPNIEGARYMSVDGIFYEIMSYSKVSQQVYQLGLKMDGILTIGINNIVDIWGTLSRQTPGNQESEVSEYMLTPEPVDQMLPYKYEYFKYNCCPTGKMTHPFICTGVDLQNKPKILNYKNEDETNNTNVYYPYLEDMTDNFTTIRSSFCGETAFSGNSAYFQWTDDVRNNYNYAVALGYEIPFTSVILPESPHINSSGSGSLATNINGNSEDIDTGLPILNSCSGVPTYTPNNVKAKYMGVFLELISPVSGDSVSINAYDLVSPFSDNVILEVGCIPSNTGYFLARFRNYQGQGDNLNATVVKSQVFPQISIISKSGESSTVNRLSTTMQMDSAELSFKTAQSTAVMDVAKQGVSGVGSLLSNSPQEAINNGLINPIMGIASTVLSVENQRRQTEQQLINLSTMGTISTNKPPRQKLECGSNMENLSYCFVVKKSQLSGYDLKNLDIFLTQYGYNVKGKPITGTSDINTGSRFTFVMATDVMIKTLKSYPNELIYDLQTRFSTGIRIWNSNPDFDYHSPN